MHIACSLVWSVVNWLFRVARREDLKNHRLGVTDDHFGTDPFGVPPWGPYRVVGACLKVIIERRARHPREALVPAWGTRY